MREKLAKARRFDEVCDSIARAVEASGIADEEFDHFFEEMRDDVWEEKWNKNPWRRTFYPRSLPISPSSIHQHS